MAMEQFRASALPLPPQEYDRQYMDSLIRVLRIYFNQLDSDAACRAYTYRANGLIFNLDGLPDLQEGQFAWNSTEQTLNLGMAYGVVQQIGQELYARVQNNTGSSIPNGTLVGFAGAGADRTLAIVPYLADGSQPSLYVLGVMTHDLPDTGEKGYCTVWGHVRDLDTTGTPYGETWSAGNILYASPTVAGGLTNVKPTAPNNCIPVAAVLAVGATDGEIFVRPTIEQQRYYGVFSDTTTQAPVNIYTPYALTFDTTDIANGISRGTPTSRIVVSESGLYRFAFSLQIETSNASAKKIWIWPRVNGADIPNSNSEVSIAGSGTTLVPAWSWTLSLNANDYFQIMYAVEDLAVSIVAKSAQTGSVGTATFARPAVPSAILEVTQVEL